MRIFAIDPGLTIGYAWYNPETGGFRVGQTNSRNHVIDWLTNEMPMSDDTYIVESYLSAGHLTKEAMQTIKLVGFFEGYIDYKWSEVILAPPQGRLSGVAQAVQMIGTEALADMHRDGKDAVAALAHALVAARRNAG